MNSYEAKKSAANGVLVLDPPTFSPPPAMRSAYLEKRSSELEAMFADARGGVWKPVVHIVNHVRGTGAMYGFPAIGDAAAELSKAIQNGDPRCLALLEVYAAAVRDARV